MLPTVGFIDNVFGVLWADAGASSSSLLLSSLELSDTQVYAPEIRALLGTAAHFYRLVVLRSRTVPNCTTLNLRILQVIRQIFPSDPPSSEADAGAPAVS